MIETKRLRAEHAARVHAGNVRCGENFCESCDKALQMCFNCGVPCVLRVQFFTPCGAFAFLQFFFLRSQRLQFCACRVAGNDGLKILRGEFVKVCLIDVPIGSISPKYSHLDCSKCFVQSARCHRVLCGKTFASVNSSQDYSSQLPRKSCWHSRQ